MAPALTLAGTNTSRNTESVTRVKQGIAAASSPVTSPHEDVIDAMVRRLERPRPIRAGRQVAMKVSLYPLNCNPSPPPPPHTHARTTVHTHTFPASVATPKMANLSQPPSMPLACLPFFSPPLPSPRPRLCTLVQVPIGRI